MKIRYNYNCQKTKQNKTIKKTKIKLFKFFTFPFLLIKNGKVFFIKFYKKKLNTTNYIVYVK